MPTEKQLANLNPKSRNPAAREIGVGTKPSLFTVLPETKLLAKKIGEGNMSRGIDHSVLFTRISDLWQRHIDKTMTQDEADELCRLCNRYTTEAGRSTFTWGDVASTKRLAQVGVWYRDLADYARSSGCGDQISQIEKLIRDVLYPLGVKGEDAQRAMLESSADSCHYAAFWDFLKRYEKIQDAG